METLGKVIGVVEDNFKITLDNAAKDEVQLRVKFDFSTCSDNDIRSWLCGNRRITMARPLRSLSIDEVRELDGQIIMANECGRKVKSREERIRELMAVGIPEVLAGYAVDNPDKFNAIMQTVDVDQDEIVE